MNKDNFNSLKNLTKNTWPSYVWKISLFIIFILFSSLFLPWQQTVKGEGVLIAQSPSERVQNISATVDGFIENLYIRENQVIKSGDKLFKMRDLDNNYEKRIINIKDNINNQMSLTNKEYNNLLENKSNLSEQLKNGEKIQLNKIQQLKDEIETIKLKKITLEQNLKIESNNYERIKELFNESIESKRSLERAENSYIKSKTEFDNNLVELNIQKRKIEIAEQELKQFLLESNNKIRIMDNSMNSNQIRLGGLSKEEQEQNSDISRFKASEVVSEKDGKILRVLVNDKNLYLSKGTPVIQFAPAVTKRTLIFKVSDFHMPLIKEGLPVRIMFYGWPSFHISGWPTIKHGTFSGIVDRVDPVSFDSEYYYAYIVEDPKEPWPDSDILKIGTRANIWVRLSVVPIWQEIWRTMNAAPATMVLKEEKNEKK
jgi:membrane fusion protein, adhesin transport system